MPEVVHVRGVVELRAALVRMAAEAPRQIAFTNKKAAEVVAAEAKVEAPVGAHEGGGAIVPIAQSIAVVATPVLASVTAGGPKTPHAAGAEFGGYIPRRGFKGISRRTKRALRLVAHSAGLTHLRRHPFLFPAATKKTAEVVALYDRMLGDLIARFER